MNKTFKTLIVGLSLTLLFFMAATSSLAETTTEDITVEGIDFVFIKGGTFVMGDILRKD